MNGSDQAFVLRFNKGLVSFSKKEIRFLLVDSDVKNLDKNNYATLSEESNQIFESVSLKFLGYQEKCELQGLEPLASKSNYFIGASPTDWETNQGNYSSLIYEQLYPGINLKYYVQDGKIKYDFILSPGADISKIRMNYSGVKSLEVDSDGALKIKTNLTELIDYLPESYQIIGGKKVLVDIYYVIRGNNTVGFMASEYDPSYQLVIDPALVYSTFVGGTNEDYEYTGGVALDAAGNIYVTGRTFSNNFPITAGAVQTTFGGNMDAFLFKLDPTGSNLIFSTFFGGANADAGYTCKLDPVTNDVYLSGTTASPTFPVTAGAVQTVYGGGLYDSFLLKLNALGNTLLYSTFLGNAQDDYGAGMDIDNFGNAYLVGQSSGPYPTTPGAYQSAYGGGPWDIFITKLNPAGNSIVFSTMIGGALEDHCHSIKVDSNYDIFIAGMTKGNFPTTAGSYDLIYNGGQWDNFVTKLNSTGTALIFSTYVGGPGADWTWNGLEIDNLGNSYVTGYTQTGFPTTPGAYQVNYGGGPFDAYVYKMNPTGTALIFSTFIGSNGDDEGWGICLNAANEIFVTGICQFGYPTTSCAYDSTLAGSDDAFISHLDPTGSAMIYSTYIGGAGRDQGYNIINRGNFVYVAGSTYSSNFPVTAGAYSTSHSGLRDIMVFQMDMSTQVLVQSGFSAPGQACVNSPVQFTNSSTGGIASFFWDFDDGSSSIMENPIHTWSSYGSYNVKLIVTSVCGVNDTSDFTVNIPQSPEALFTPLEECNLTYTFSNISGTAFTYTWNFGDGMSSSTNSPTHVYALPGIYEVELIAEGSGTCYDTLKQTIVVRAVSSALFSFTPPTCNQTINFQNLSSNSSNYIWSFGDGTYDTLSNPIHTFPTAGNYLVTLISEPSFCPDTIIQNLTINSVPVSVFTDTTLCNFEVQFSNQSIGGTNMTWDFGDGTYSNALSPNHIFSGPGVYAVSLLAVNSFGCRDSTVRNVQVLATSIAGFSFPPLVCEQGVQFQNSSIRAVDYLWVFGDGNQVNSLNPLHYFPAPGQYTVKLITDPFACPDSVEQTLTINEPPSAAFSQTSDCQSGFQFNDGSSGANNYFWDFGDGSTSAQASPFHLYAFDGQYNVTFYVQNPAGCKDSIIQLLLVAPNSIADFSTPQLICESNVPFSNLSINATNYFWDFGDGAFSTVNEPIHEYLNPGIFLARLITNSNNCPDTTSQFVYVNSKPIAAFQKVTDCGLAVQFLDIGFNSYNYTWSFGDGGVSSDSDPVHLFSNPGIYNVSLSVKSAAGCVDSTSDLVEILFKANPQFEFVFDTCSNQAVFINQTLNSTAYLWDFNDGVLSTEQHPVHSYYLPGVYSIALYSNIGTHCIDSLLKEITIPETEESSLYIPNCFTPNGDGKNECFEILARGSCVNYKLDIFNRWGELIYSTDDLSNCWDGTYNGRIVQEGVYCYLLKNSEGQRTGVVNVFP